MTGRYPWRFRPPRPDGPWGFLNPRFAKGQMTIGRLLQRRGYATGYVGKWHLGTRMQTTDGKNQGPKNVDFKRPITLGPNDFGFNYSFILPGSLDMYPYVFVRNHQFLGPVTKQRGWSAFNRVGPTADDFEDHRVLDSFAREAESFIERAAEKKGQPFFLYLALTAPHTPVAPSEGFRGKSKLGVYGDFVMETDHCLQRVLAALDKHQLASNTLVIATSDHGAASYAGNRLKATPGQLFELERQGHFSSGVHRGYKFSIYEGGLRVPFVARWPGTIPPGSVARQTIGLHDLWATFAELTGQPEKPNEGVDSMSFLSALRDPARGKTRETIILRSVRSYAIRQGRWKLAVCPGSGCPGVYGNTPKMNDAWRAALNAYGKQPTTRKELEQAAFVQLFDLEADPGESRNLARDKPEVVKALLDKLKQQIAAGRSTPGPSQRNDRTLPLFSAVPAFVLQRDETK